MPNLQAIGFTPIAAFRFAPCTDRYADAGCARQRAPCRSARRADTLTHLSNDDHVGVQWATEVQWWRGASAQAEPSGRRPAVRQSSALCVTQAARPSVWRLNVATVCGGCRCSATLGPALALQNGHAALHAAFAPEAAQCVRCRGRWSSRAGLWWGYVERACVLDRTMPATTKR